jgi:hypothetical protein
MLSYSGSRAELSIRSRLAQAAGIGCHFQLHAYGAGLNSEVATHQRRRETTEQTAVVHAKQRSKSRRVRTSWIWCDRHLAELETPQPERKAGMWMLARYLVSRAGFDHEVT